MDIRPSDYLEWLQDIVIDKNLSEKLREQMKMFKDLWWELQRWYEFWWIKIPGASINETKEIALPKNSIVDSIFHI